MKNYCALINNNVVVEIIVGDFAWVTENLAGDWHDLGGEPLTIAVGWTYNPETNQFTAPPAEESVEP